MSKRSGRKKFWETLHQIINITYKLTTLNCNNITMTTMKYHSYNLVKGFSNFVKQNTIHIPVDNNVRLPFT
jgi:hypothetical protein